MLDVMRTMLTVGPEGLRFGDATLLARMADGRIDFAADELRSRALLEAAYGGSVPDETIERIVGAVGTWNAGRHGIAIVRLIHIGLPDPLGDPDAAERLSRTAWQWDMGLLPEREELDKRGHGHGHAGSGHTGYTPDATTKEQFLSPDEMKYAPPAFRDKIAELEGSTGYDTRTNNATNALGRYQILKRDLHHAGLSQFATGTAWGNTAFARAFGIKTDRDFLHNPEAQDAAFAQYMKVRQPEGNVFFWRYGGKTYYGVDRSSITVTKAGIFGAMHRAGGPLVGKYLKKYQAKSTQGKTLDSHLLENAIETRLRIMQDVPYDP